MGWKDILRPIRDGLRDNLPSKPPRRDPEKDIRCEQDALKGFTYFDSFQDVDDWRPDQAYSFQRANTPLLLRSCPNTVDGRARVTLIHDFSGNYHDYEDVHWPGVDRPSYSCLQSRLSISVIWLRHSKLVCVPPPSWTNTLHRNGVKSLGTLLVEPQSAGMSRILQQSPSNSGYTLASQLSRIADFYGFDGWLINVEKTFPIADWNLSKLEGFLKQLSASSDPGCVIWYDSLTVKNRIEYQNALTEQNIILAKAAGSVLTNYVWTDDTATKSKIAALRHDIDPANVLCGIDVWAQGSECSRRKTYPKDIGGGTGTGLGVSKLAEVGLSAGIFAPAWPYEHFASLSDSQDVDRSMWTGSALPKSLDCECASKRRHFVEGYRAHPILERAREHPAGSKTFFYTDFTQAFTIQSGHELRGSIDGLRASLASQSITPRCISRARDRDDIFGRLESCPSRLSLYARTPQAEYTKPRELSLFRLSILVSERLLVSITYQKFAAADLWLRLDGLDIRIPIVGRSHEQNTVTEQIQADGSGRTHLMGLSLLFYDNEQVAVGDTLLLADIMQICVRQEYHAARSYTLSEVVLQEIDEVTSCLSWKFDDGEEVHDVSHASRDGDGLPHSNMTGPFSFFIIDVNGTEVGRAYALDFLLQDLDDESKIQIKGVGFDGEVICAYSGRLRKRRRQGSMESWHGA
ncbi:hypothetical protein E4T42_08572 [Aureobasidium subglaciale]|nr:hypothetical protein E4T42_08572 [Aureobasidium subglaciale]